MFNLFVYIPIMKFSPLKSLVLSSIIKISSFPVEVKLYSFSSFVGLSYPELITILVLSEK